jgi:hypothetical protein
LLQVQAQARARVQVQELKLEHLPHRWNQQSGYGRKVAHPLHHSNRQIYWL